MPVIRVENATKKYTEEGRSLYAVRDLSLTVEQGDFVFLIPKKEASRIFRDCQGPYDMSVVGFIDTYNEEL